MKKLFALPSLAFAALVCSSILVPSNVQAQSSACDWFTGAYRDLGKGVIVHLGEGRLVVYNGNPTPLTGRCIDNERIEVSFRRNLTLVGRKTRNAPDVAWSNGTVWRREGDTVSFPISGF